MLTLKELCAKYSVSLSTVQHRLNGAGNPHWTIRIKRGGSYVYDKDGEQELIDCGILRGLMAYTHNPRAYKASHWSPVYPDVPAWIRVSDYV